MSSVFTHSSYRQYLTTVLDTSPRGTRALLAKKLRCQNAYISRILAGKADISAEQAYEACRFFNLSAIETDYFLLLVQENRAGTATLKKYYRAKLTEILGSQSKVKNRIGKTSTLDEPDASIYYSEWFYAAIHTALTVPALQSTERLSQHLGLSTKIIAKALQQLAAIGLVTIKHGKPYANNFRLHISDESTLVNRHHINWRLKAIASLPSAKDSDLHYTSVISCSEKDVMAIRDILMAAVTKVREIVKEADEEGVYAYHLDLYDLRLE